MSDEQNVISPERAKHELALREARRREMAEVSFQSNANGGALLMPRDGRELMDMANTMAQSGLMVRDFYRSNAGACAALIMICAPYGLNPYMVSWKTYRASKNDDAPISFEAQLINAMLNMSAPIRGKLIPTYIGEGVTRQCLLRPLDRASGEELPYDSPMIGQIKVQNSPSWKADPDQQLFYYASRAWARRYFPELLLGIYAKEEMEVSEVRDVTPQEPKQNPMAAIAAKARAEAQTETVAEATVSDADQTHWTDGIAWDEGAPGSDAWDAGAEAFKVGQPITSCPHEGNEQAAADWLAAWHGAQRAAE